MSKIIIYTDGACSNNQEKDNFGGWGAVLLFKQNKKELYGGTPNTSNNKMELMACIEALKALKTTKYPVEIYTDSAYIVNCFEKKWYIKWQNNNWRNSKKDPVSNKEFWEELLLLKDKYNAKFIKVAGHSGIELNEQADALARKGAQEAQANKVTV